MNRLWTNKALTFLSIWTFLFTSLVLCGVPFAYWLVYKQPCELSCRLQLFTLCFQYIALLVTVGLYLARGIDSKRRTFTIRMGVLGIVNGLTLVLLMVLGFLWLVHPGHLVTMDVIVLCAGMVQVYTLFLVILSFVIFDMKQETFDSWTDLPDITTS